MQVNLNAVCSVSSGGGVGGILGCRKKNHIAYNIYPCDGYIIIKCSMPDSVHSAGKKNDGESYGVAVLFLNCCLPGMASTLRESPPEPQAAPGLGALPQLPSGSGRRRFRPALAVPAQPPAFLFARGQRREARACGRRLGASGSRFRAPSTPSPSARCVPGRAALWAAVQGPPPSPRREPRRQGGNAEVSRRD